MEESNWWSKLFLISACISVFLLVSGPLGYKYEFTALLPSLVSLLVALAGASIVFVAALIMLIVAIKNGLTIDRNIILISMAICLIPIVVMGPQISKARGVPPIHDISTDTEDPPEFNVVVGLREGAPNDLVYELEGSPEKLAETQIAAYPTLETRASDLSVPDAVNRAAEILADHGLEIVNTDIEAGLVEATATTYWFGFKDDLVVRVRETATGSDIDVRSVSRVGQSDIGANAARISRFLNDF